MSRFERLQVLDELFLHLEGPNTHMHVGGVAVFDGSPPDLHHLLNMIGPRLQMIPRFRKRLAEVPFGVGRPVWVDDSHFNLSYHVRRTALPPPGDDSELKSLVARIMSQQLDRSHPLWELWLVEGMSPDRFALISKTHHCLIDGISGVDIMSVLLDVGEEAQPITPEQWVPSPQPSDDELLADAVRELLTSPSELIRTVQSGLMDPGHLSHRVVEGLRALGEFLGNSFSAPESSLNKPIGPHRRFETVLANLHDFKVIKNTLGGTVNDVVLSVTAGALRALFQARGEPVQGVELRGMVPVSVRPDADRGELGNRIASVWAALPVYEADPVTRLRIVRNSMKDLRRSGQAVGAQVLTSIGEYAPSTVLAHAARFVARQRAFNLVVTNVPGPQFPLYVLGRRLKEVYPVLPLAANTTLGVALFSYNGTVGFGLVGDHDLAPDLAVLAEGIEKSLAELLHVAE
jgi:diacylglycerol O-acyltransferase / wax synthase